MEQSTIRAAVGPKGHNPHGSQTSMVMATGDDHSRLKCSFQPRRLDQTSRSRVNADTIRMGSQPEGTPSHTAVSQTRSWTTCSITADWDVAPSPECWTCGCAGRCGCRARSARAVGQPVGHIPCSSQSPTPAKRRSQQPECSLQAERWTEALHLYPAQHGGRAQTARRAPSALTRPARQSDKAEHHPY